jgi:putative endonuclease
MGTFYVYIMASRSRVLYVGVTNDLARRVDEHKGGLIAGFTSRYRVTRLVYFEEFVDILDAIAREKEIKGWVRTKKIRLIDSSNPTWEDLADQWFQDGAPFSSRSSSPFLSARAKHVILGASARTRAGETLLLNTDLEEKRSFKQAARISGSFRLRALARHSAQDDARYLSREKRKRRTDRSSISWKHSPGRWPRYPNDKAAVTARASR